MSFNMTFKNSGTPFNINFTSLAINSFYYDVAADGIFAREIIENSGFSEMIQVTPTGIVYLKGTKQINGGFSKRFEITPSGNLISRMFTTQF